MENFFTYTIYLNSRLLKIGKGHCFRKNQDAVESYLHSRYGYSGWNRFSYNWHFSEAAALKAETKQIDSYIWRNGNYPPWNSASGGGGRQIYQKCKAITVKYLPCNNDALTGNYGFCGVHR